jgi:hypothetical protein
MARILGLGLRPFEAWMKLDFHGDGSTDCPILRLYAFTPAEAGHLLAAVSELASEVNNRVELHRLPFVAPVGPCRLTLVVTSRDQAVTCIALSEYVCGFTANTWDNVAGLIEPFAKSAQGFQWLAESPGEAALLLSVSGQW